MRTFLDFCSGIGGFRLGLELAGYQCKGFCEKDKFAVKSYKAMFNTEGEWYRDDVTNLIGTEVPYADIWCFGFPCQDISIAGKQRGLSGKRSGIYFNIIDLIKSKKEEDKPTYLLIENVKNLLSINQGFDFTTVLTELDEAGYDAMWQLLNSKYFGVPQNRERVFIIAILRSRGRREILPLTGNGGGEGGKTGLYFIDQSTTKVEITDTSRCITSRYTAGVVNRTAMNSGVLEAKAVLTPDRIEKRQNGRRYKTSNEPMYTLAGTDEHGVAIKEATKQGYVEANLGDSINMTFPESQTRRGRVGKGIAQTLDTSCNQGILDKHYRIRRLTPKECFRLQGFPDELFEKAKAVNSDAQLYKQAGNAVTVPVAYAVAKSLVW